MLINYIDANRVKAQTLRDAHVNSIPKSGKRYQLAYASGNALIKVGMKMGFAETLLAMGITGSLNKITMNTRFSFSNKSIAKFRSVSEKSSAWGIYSESQFDAKALAVVFGCKQAPKVDRSGQYGHYHDPKRHFHIWFGGKINY